MFLSYLAIDNRWWKIELLHHADGDGTTAWLRVVHLSLEQNAFDVRVSGKCFCSACTWGSTTDNGNSVLLAGSCNLKWSCEWSWDLASAHLIVRCCGNLPKEDAVPRAEMSTRDASMFWIRLVQLCNDGREVGVVGFRCSASDHIDIQNAIFCLLHFDLRLCSVSSFRATWTQDRGPTILSPLCCWSTITTETSCSASACRATIWTTLTRDLKKQKPWLLKLVLRLSPQLIRKTN